MSTRPAIVTVLPAPSAKICAFAPPIALPPLPLTASPPSPPTASVEIVTPPLPSRLRSPPVSARTKMSPPVALPPTLPLPPMAVADANTLPVIVTAAAFAALTVINPPKDSPRTPAVPFALIAMAPLIISCDPESLAPTNALPPRPVPPAPLAPLSPPRPLVRTSVVPLIRTVPPRFASSVAAPPVAFAPGPPSRSVSPIASAVTRTLPLIVIAPPLAQISALAAVPVWPMAMVRAPLTSTLPLIVNAPPARVNIRASRSELTVTLPVIAVVAETSMILLWTASDTNADVVRTSVIEMPASPVPDPADRATRISPSTMSLPADSTIVLPTAFAAPAMSKPSVLPAVSSIVSAWFLGTATR